MLEFKDLEIEDKEIINKYLAKSQSMGSESSFTNLFMWRKSYHVKYAIYNDWLIVRSGGEKKWWYLPPYGEGEDLAGTIEEMIATAKELGQEFCLKALQEKHKNILENLFAERFEFIPERENFDYIYDAQSLRTLAGRKLHSKRNHLNYFLNNVSYSYEVLTKDNLQEAMDFLEEWCSQKVCDKQKQLDDMLVCEKDAIKEIFAAFDELDCVGALIRLEGKVKAFTLGEMLTNNTAVIHIEKADHEVRGLYPAINQLFLTNNFPQAELVNREEDTGDEGLRKAKLSYYPKELLTKYKGVLR